MIALFGGATAAVLLAAFVVAVRRIGALPPRIPISFDWRGRPWPIRGPRWFFAFPQAMLIAIFPIVQFAYAHPTHGPTVTPLFAALVDLVLIEIAAFVTEMGTRWVAVAQGRSDRLTPSWVAIAVLFATIVGMGLAAPR